MKEFVAIAFNPMLSKVGGGLKGTGKIVLVHSEPHNVGGEGGNIERVRETGEFRIGMDARALRMLAANAVEYAEGLEASVHADPALADVAEVRP